LVEIVKKTQAFKRFSELPVRAIADKIHEVSFVREQEYEMMDNSRIDFIYFKAGKF
jgi:hypothetical protein